MTNDHDEPREKIIYCMYCNHQWTYKGSNFTNICCPKCKNRFDVTQGKAKHFNDLHYKLIQLEGGNTTNDL